MIRLTCICSLLLMLSTSCGAGVLFDRRSLAANTNNGTNNNKDKTITFSVLLNPAANIKAADLKPPQSTNNNDTLSSKASDLYTSVMDVTRKVLCQETNFEMIVNGTDSCTTRSSGTTKDTETRTTTTNTTKLEASYNQIGVAIQDKSPDPSLGLSNTRPLTWLEFTLHYPVLQTTTTNKNTYKVAQKAIRNSITDHTFANLLQAANLNNDVMAVANVGEEQQVFVPWAQLWESLLVVVDSVENNSTTSTTTTTSGTAISLDSTLLQFFYPMRIVGLVLLAFTILFVSFMMMLAQRRKKKRELEEEERKRGTTTALHTNDGLNAMLEVGREVTLRRRMNPVT